MLSVERRARNLWLLKKDFAALWSTMKILNVHENKTGNIRINITLMPFRVTTVAVEKQ
jgi:hypothetical protein